VSATGDADYAEAIDELRCQVVVDVCRTARAGKQYHGGTFTTSVEYLEAHRSLFSRERPSTGKKSTRWGDGSVQGAHSASVRRQAASFRGGGVAPRQGEKGVSNDGVCRSGCGRWSRPGAGAAERC
jgi:hypothetical protein